MLYAMHWCSERAQHCMERWLLVGRGNQCEITTKLCFEHKQKVSKALSTGSAVVGCGRTRALRSKSYHRLPGIYLGRFAWNAWY